MTTIYDFYKTILSKDYYYTPYEAWYDFERDINKQRNGSSGIELFRDNDCKVDYICVYFVQDRNLPREGRLRLEIFKPTNGAVDVFRFKNEDGSYNSRILVKDNEIKVYSFDKNVNVKFELNLDDDSIKVTHNNLETDVETLDIDIVNIVGKIYSTMFGNECKDLRDCELKFKNLFLATRSALVLSILDLYRRWIDMLQLEISNIQHEASQIAIELYNPESEISKLGRDGFYDKMAEYYNRIDYLERIMERIQKYMYDQNIKGKYQK